MCEVKYLVDWFIGYDDLEPQIWTLDRFDESFGDYLPEINKLAADEAVYCHGVTDCVVVTCLGEMVVN